MSKQELFEAIEENFNTLSAEKQWYYKSITTESKKSSNED